MTTITSSLTPDNLEFISGLESSKKTSLFTKLENSTIIDYQVFGERSSGTNYLDNLIHSNTALKSTKSYGWKHGYPVSLAYHRSSLIFMVVRHPLDWAISMFNNPHAVHPDIDASNFSNFIRGPWAMFIRPRIYGRWKKPWGMTVRNDVGNMENVFDRNPLTGNRFNNIFEMRYAKMNLMLSIRNRNSNFAFSTYEAINCDPRKFITELCELYNVEQFPNLKIETESLNPTVRKKKISKNDITDSDLDYIKSCTCPQTENALGYQF